MTPEELDRNSRARASDNRRRFIVLAVLSFLVFLVLATLLQIQQSSLQGYVRQQCLQRQINVQRSNQIWADLAQTEEHSRDDPATRVERLRIYRNAHLDVPICT